MNSFSSSPLFLPQSNSISFSILSLFHYLDLLHQPKKNALSLFTTQRLHGLSLTSSTSFIREWALAFDVLLKTSIQSDIKSINDLSLHSQKVSLVLDEIVYDLRLENQIELAHQFENCIQRLLSLFQSKTIHLGFSYLIYSLPTENSFRMCDGHTLASLLIVFRELAACSYHTTTNDTSIFSNSHQNEENSLIYPSLSVPFGQNQMENESLKSLTLNSMFPSLSSSSSLPLPSSVHGLESMIPYAILSENPTLRSKHFRDPWGVLYTLSDFQLPISKTFHHSFKNSPFSTSLNAPPLPSLDKSPFFLESPLSSTPTISTTHFASLPLDAKLKLPVLDSVHPSSILDSISLPSPVSLTPSLSSFTRSSYSDLYSLVETEKATMDEYSQKSIHDQESTPFNRNEDSNLEPESSLDSIRLLLMYSNESHNCTPNILTWDNVKLPSIHCFGPSTEIHYSNPFLVTNQPQAFDSIYHSLAHDALNPPLPLVNSSMYLTHALQLLCGLESPCFVWNTVEKVFHLRRLFRISGYSTAMTNVFNNTCLTIATFLRRCEVGATYLRESKSKVKGALLKSLGTAFIDFLHALRQQFIFSVKNITSVRIFVHYLQPFFHHLQNLDKIVCFDQEHEIDLSRVIFSRTVPEETTLDLFHSPTAHQVVPLLGLHILHQFINQLIGIDALSYELRNEQLLYTWLFRFFQSILQPVLQWIQRWIQMKDLGENRTHLDVLDPYHEYWITLYIPSSFSTEQHTFWNTGYVLRSLAESRSDSFSSFLTLDIQERVIRIQKWYSVLNLSSEHQLQLYEWLQGFHWPKSWQQMTKLEQQLKVHDEVVHTMTTPNDSQPHDENASHVLHLAQRMTEAIERRCQVWEDQKRTHAFHAFLQKQALLKEIHVFLEAQSVWKSHQQHEKEVETLKEIKTHLSNQYAWHRKIETEKKALLQEYQRKVDLITKEGLKLAWRKARLLHRQGLLPLKGLPTPFLDLKTASMLIEDDSNNNLSPISSKTSLDSPPSLPIDLNLLHQPVQLQNDEQINFVDSTSPMSIDEDRNRTISPISIDLPHSGFEPKSSSNSEIFSSCYNLDEGNYPFEKEKEKEKKITADHEEMQLNSLSLSTPRTSPNHNLVSSSSYKEGVAITEQFTKKADFRLKLGKKTSSDSNKVSNDSDSNSLHFLPSPTQSIHYDTSSSIYRNSSFFSLSSLTSTPVQDDQSDQEVPFTIALHYFQAWLHHHLVLTETQCLYYFFKFTRPQLYVPWIQRYFLMQDATFRDQLSNLLFSESILFVISDPHGLATRLNIILEHEPSLSFVFHKEKIPSLSQGWCDFLSLELKLELPFSLFFFNSHLQKYQRIFQFLLHLLSIHSILIQLPVSLVRFQAMGFITSLFTSLSRGFSSMPSIFSSNPLEAFHQFQTHHETQLDQWLMWVNYGQVELQSLFQVIYEVKERKGEMESVHLRFRVLMNAYLDNMPTHVKHLMSSTWSSFPPS